MHVVRMMFFIVLSIMDWSRKFHKNNAHGRFSGMEMGARPRVEMLFLEEMRDFLAGRNAQFFVEIVDVGFHRAQAYKQFCGNLLIALIL